MAMTCPSSPRTAPHARSVRSEILGATMPTDLVHTDRVHTDRVHPDRVHPDRALEAFAPDPAEVRSGSAAPDLP